MAQADRTRAQVLAALLSGPKSRTELALGLGLSQSTVTKVITPLLAHGYVRETGDKQVNLGRPRTMLQVNPSRASVAGIKLAPDHVTGVLVDLGGRSVHEEVQPLESTEPDRALAQVAALARSLVAATPVSAGAAVGVGIGLGGHIDSHSGVCRYSSLLGWNEVQVREPIELATGLPTVVSNDVNSLVVAEHTFGEGVGLDSFAVVTVGAGVGAGFLLQGELFDGSTGMAGEFGHIPVDPDGPECSCGNLGCLEAVASQDAILRRIREAGGPRFRGLATAARAARSPRQSGHSQARRAFEEAGEAMGRGIAVLLNLLNLEKVIVAGEAMIASDLFGEALTESVSAHAFSTAARDCELVFQPVDDAEWARGAACLVVGAAVGSAGALSTAASRMRLVTNGGIT